MNEAMNKPVNIPHAPPMHWLDSAVISEDGLTASATRTILADQPFVLNGQLLSAALIELMAQAAAAASSLNAARENKRIRRGVLAGLREFRIQGPALVGATVEIIAHHEKTFGALSMGRMEARIDGRLIASARMTFHLDFE